MSGFGRMPGSHSIRFATEMLMRETPANISQNMLILGDGRVGKTSIAFQLALERAVRGGLVLYICKEEFTVNNSWPMPVFFEEDLSGEGGDGQFELEVFPQAALNRINIKTVRAAGDLVKIIASLPEAKQDYSLVVIDGLTSLLDPLALVGAGAGSSSRRGTYSPSRTGGGSSSGSRHNKNELVLNMIGCLSLLEVSCCKLAERQPHPHPRARCIIVDSLDSYPPHTLTLSRVVSFCPTMVLLKKQVGESGTGGAPASAVHVGVKVYDPTPTSVPPSSSSIRHSAVNAHSDFRGAFVYSLAPLQGQGHGQGQGQGQGGGLALVISV